MEKSCPFLELLEHKLVPYFESLELYFKMRKLGVDQEKDTKHIMDEHDIIKKDVERVVVDIKCEVVFDPEKIEKLKEGGY